jgi:cell division protein FtsL
MMVYVWKQIKINQLAKEVNALQRKKEQLVNETKTLQMEIAGLSRLSRIGEIAMKKVNLQYPDQYPVVFKLTPAEEQSKPMVTAAVFGRVHTAMDYVKTLLLPIAEAGAPTWE